MLHRFYRLAPHARLEERDGEHLLFSHHPLRQFTLNESAWRLMSALDGDTALDALVSDLDPAVIDFLEDKVRAGLLVAEYRVTPPAEWPPVEVIVPVYDNLAALTRCLEGLAMQGYPRDRFVVIVVDDASPGLLLDGLIGHDLDGLTTAWRHLRENLGPGGARNAGAGIFAAEIESLPGDRVHLHAPILAFLDSDCVPASDWLENLVAALDDPGLVAVGGGVRGLRFATLLARYEAECASLFMGERPGPAAKAEGGAPYLPACNLAVKRKAFEQVGGFRPELRLGEDVDLCWRLAEQGGELFYFPAAVVRHEYRDRLGAFLQRKRQYATSEAHLRRAYPERFRRRGWWAFPLILAVLGAGIELTSLLLLGLGLLMPLLLSFFPIVRGRRMLGRFSLGQISAAWLRRSAGLGLREARRFTRVTLILWVAPLAAFPRLIPLAVVAFGLGAAGEWLARRPRLPVPLFVAGFAAECLAYSVGKAEGELVSAVAALRRGILGLLRGGLRRLRPARSR
jgi:mycofactocin system glycosyltransferase